MTNYRMNCHRNGSMVTIDFDDKGMINELKKTMEDHVFSVYVFKKENRTYVPIEEAK